MSVTDTRPRAPRPPPTTGTTLARMQTLSAIGATVDALEQIVSRGDLGDEGPFAWSVHRPFAERVLSPAVVRLLDPVLRHPRFVAVPHARLIAAAALLSGRVGSRRRAALLATLCGTNVAAHLRHRIGGDGSDHMSFVVFMASALAEAFPDDELIQQMCVRFVAFQSCVSYATSGAVKLVSPIWRSGEAVTGVFRTRTYGDQGLYRILVRYPVLAKVLAWAVILGELSFPLVLFASPRGVRAVLAGGALFHLANGRFMGLNRFFWAFVGTYPAVAHVAAARQGRSLGGGDR